MSARVDETAFTRIVARYHPDLLRIALVVCGDVDVAAEAAQAAWVVAWRRLRELRDPANLRPWLMSIAAKGSVSGVAIEDWCRFLETHP